MLWVSCLLAALVSAAVDPAAAGIADVALIARAIGGDDRALRQLAERLLPVLRARARWFLARVRGGRVGADDGDDLVQETWLVLMADGARALRQYDPVRGASLEGYVGMIANREITNRARWFRSRKRGGDAVQTSLDDVGELHSHAADPEAEAVVRSTLEALSAHLERELPARGQLVLRCIYTDGRSPDEAAQMIGVNTQVIYNWQHKIRRLTEGFLAEPADGVA